MKDEALFVKLCQFDARNERIAKQLKGLASELAGLTGEFSAPTEESPCPFCGWRAHLESLGDACFMRCSDGEGCGADGPVRKGSVSAEAWGLRDDDGCDLRLWATEAEANFAACDGHRVVRVKVVEVTT